MSSDIDEQFAFLRLVVKRLNDAQIPYMLTGSIALAIYAIARMTRDIDFVIDSDEKRVATLVAAFTVDSYASDEAARDAVQQLGMFNVIHLESQLKADFILLRRTEYEQQKFDRRREVDLGGFVVTVISPEDLVLSKLNWSRDSGSVRQEEDVRVMLQRSPALDWSYLALWSERLGLKATIERLRAE